MEKSLENNVLYSDLVKQMCEQIEINLLILQQNSPNDPEDPDEEWNPDCFLMDKLGYIFNTSVYKKKMYEIDYFPKLISLDNKFPQLELFYRSDDKYGLNGLFFEEAKKVLRVLSRLWAYSAVYVESSLYYHPPEEEADKDEKLELILQLFANSAIIQMEEWKSVQYLCEQSLKYYGSVCLYFVDLKIVIWLRGLCPTAYICDQEQVDFVRTICMTEGVYLQK